MDKVKKIKELLEGFGIKPNFPIAAEVVSIQGDTCTIKLASSLVITDVRLKATMGLGDNYFLTVPKIGSQVIVFSQTGELSALMVLKINEIEKIQIKQNGLELLVDAEDGKVVLKNEAANLHTVFNDLATALLGFAVNTPSGPSLGLMPVSVTQINDFKTKINLLLKAN